MTGGYDRSEEVRDKKRAALSSVAAGALLTGVKLGAGLYTGSLGLLAEAAHSALDLGAAGVTWVAVRASWRPPDEEHHYGHGKIENLAALVETFLLVATSAWILREAALRFAGGGPEVDPSVWAFAVVGLSIVVDLLRSRDLKRVAERTGSQALEADALHFSSDIASSAVVLLGLTGVALARRPGWEWLRLADPAAASVVAVFVLFLSWKLGKRSVDMLLDRAPADSARGVRAALRSLNGISGDPGVRLRQAGDWTFVDVEIALRRGLPLAEGERIAERARQVVREAVGERSTVLVQLRATPDADASVRDRVATAVAMEGMQAHNISVLHDDAGYQADLHLEVPAGLTLNEGHAVADRVERRILAEIRDVRRVDIHIEQHGTSSERTEAVDSGTERALREQVARIGAIVVGPGRVHDVLLRRTGRGVYLSCHCFLPPGTPLTEAHETTERLEIALRREMPELVRVNVHAEPEGIHG